MCQISGAMERSMTNVSNIKNEQIVFLIRDTDNWQCPQINVLNQNY
jgi:hypothetical protein